jgi:hypothetical protein
VIVDDSRTRKLTGYFHVWSKVQSIRWVVDVVEAKRKQHASVGRAAEDGQEVLGRKLGAPM